MLSIPQPQVLELDDEIPPEFTRSAFAGLFERTALHLPEAHVSQPHARQPGEAAKR
jgi:hypothetical protein